VVASGCPAAIPTGMLERGDWFGFQCLRRLSQLVFAKLRWHLSLKTKETDIIVTLRNRFNCKTNCYGFECCLAYSLA